MLGRRWSNSHRQGRGAAGLVLLSASWLKCGRWALAGLAGRGPGTCSECTLLLLQPSPRRTPATFPTSHWISRQQGEGGQRVCRPPCPPTAPADSGTVRRAWPCNKQLAVLRAVFARTWQLHTTTANEKNGHPHHPPTGLIGQPFTAPYGGRS